MPIIKSAKKRVKQAEVRRVRNFRYRRALHDAQKEFYALIKEGDATKAAAKLPEVYKVIDTCDKKNILQSNKAGRLKSKAQKSLSKLTAK